MKQTVLRLGNVSSVIAAYGITLFLLVQASLQLMPTRTMAMQPSLLPAVSIDTKELPKQRTSGIPVRLSIPSLDMEKVIKPGVYDWVGATWPVSPRDIHYADLSSPINDLAGNTLIYGHNNKHVFGPLKKLAVSDTVTIETDSGYLFTYKYVGKSDYEPQDTSIFAYEGQPLLTLMTCSGMFNEIRTFYTFSLERFREI